MADLIPLDKALEFLLGDVTENPEVTEVSLSDASGCVLAETMCAGIDVPDFDNSAMDGYAVHTNDIEQNGCSLPVSQTVAAGHPGEALKTGTVARIFTGAPIPAGADAVVMQENTRAEGDMVTIMEKPVPGENIRLKGHDIEAGSEVLQIGHRLRPQDLGLLASLGISRINVKRPLTVAIITTGDEVIPPDQSLQPGQLHDSNSYSLEALLKGVGMEVTRCGNIGDGLAETEEALEKAAGKADCIITTGGVSVGEEDHVKQAVDKLGQLALWKLAIKPGKPFSYGRVSGRPFFGLPGNPVAVFVTFVLLVRPFLLKMQGALNLEAPKIPVKAGFEILKTGSRLEFIRVRLVNTENGEQFLEAFGNQGSSVLTSLSWADGLAEIPLGETVSKGERVNYIPFRGIL